jgi:hypothetical protein
MELKINFIAVIVATVVNFILAFVWYTPLFGKAWAIEKGLNPDEKPSSSMYMRGIVFMLIGNFLLAWVFAHNIAAWTFVPDMANSTPFSNAMMSAIFTFLGFYLPGQLSATVWAKHSWKLFFIETGYQLLALIAAAFILCYWKA